MLRDSPYQGLRPFKEDDAPFFFGRETETRLISASLRTSPLTLLYGPSGVGKSSVLQAGVIHNLRRLNARLQLNQEIILDDDFEEDEGVEDDAYTSVEGDTAKSGRSIVAVTFDNWVDDPHLSLKEAILTSLSYSLPSIFTPEKNDELGRQGLNGMLEHIAGYPQVMELLIILDQFEQYFVYPRVDEEPGRFVTEFCRAVSSRKLRANFLISIREDWLASLDFFTGEVPSIFDNSIRIGHLDLESAKAAILKPVQSYNELIQKHADQLGSGGKQGTSKKSFVARAINQLKQLLKVSGLIRTHQIQPGSDRKRVRIEAGFVTEAINQLKQLDPNGIDRESSDSSGELKPEKSRIQASGMQIVLQRLWNRVKNGDPPTLSQKLLPPGEAKRIFQSYLDDSLKPLSFREKLLAERLLPLLSTSSGAKLADTTDSLAERSRRKPARVEALVKKLTETKILNEHGPLTAQARNTQAPNTQAPVPYEITSDVLAAPILNWVRKRSAKRLAVKIGTGVVVLVAVAAWLAVGVQQRFQEAKRRREAAEIENKRVDSAKWEKLRRSFAEGDKQIPYLKAVLRGHTARVTSAVFTSDGQVLTSSADGSAVLWDPETTDPIRQFGDHDEKPIVHAAINPDGNLVVTANTDGTVWLWQRSTGYSIQLRGHVGKHVTDISFSPNGDLIAAANTNGDLMVWNSNTLDLVANRVGGGRPTFQISFSPSGKLLGTASDDATAQVWQVGNWSQPMVMTGHSAKVNGLAFSPDEKSLATASADSTARLWDLKNGQTLRVFSGHTASVNSISFDSSGQRLVTASDDGTARIWNVNGGPPIELRGHKDKVLSAVFSPTGLQVVTGSRDETARIWLATTGEPLVELRGHSKQVSYVSYSKDGDYVLTASDDATARVWFAPESGVFEINMPVIEAKPNVYQGSCPVIISFDVSITARKGSGSVLYRFKGSDGRIWPTEELVFDKPDTKYLKWYWRITESVSGSETIEILEPRDIKGQKAKFTVRCITSETLPPEPATTSKPASTSAPSPASSVPAPTPPSD